jgi:predicted nucleic acid-binding protein
VFSDLADFSPEMDLADGCLVTLSRRMHALVVTTDDRDFSIYRVPYLSPRGLYARNV